MNKWFNIALREAKKSAHKYKMAAAIVKGGRLLSSKSNGSVTGKHAETRTLGLTDKTLGATIYIARYGGEGTSRPCRQCFEAIRDSGIKKMVFFEDGKLELKLVSEENIEDYRDYKIPLSAAY